MQDAPPEKPRELKARDLTNREIADALVAGELLLWGFHDNCAGRVHVFVGECDCCGFVTTLHDAEDDRGNVVAYHCGACCDRGTCGARRRCDYDLPLRRVVRPDVYTHAVSGLPDDVAQHVRARLALPRDYPPGPTPLLGRAACLACRATAAGVPVRCDVDHGCDDCGHVEALHEHTPEGRRCTFCARLGEVCGPAPELVAVLAELADGGPRLRYVNPAHPGECNAPGPCEGCDAVEAPAASSPPFSLAPCVVCGGSEIAEAHTLAMCGGHKYEPRRSS